MKVLLLADINNSHILKWVSAFKSSGIELAIFSLSPLQPHNADYYSDVKVECLDFDFSSGSLLQKSRYFLAIPKIRKLYKSFDPDIVHAHYASSYGLLGALMGFRIFLISVWGSDVYVFPKQGVVFKKFLKFSLKKADHIFSTSPDMARETMLYTSKTPTVIPFGVNTAAFKRTAQVQNDNSLHFATAKSLRPVYNIPVVISAFKKIVEECKDAYLHIAGDGPQMQKCVEMAGDLINDRIYFCGALAHDEMPHFFQNKDVLINIPDSESFGVSVLEASASELAIIATDKGGLKEVVLKDETGVLISGPGEEELIAAMKLFIQNVGLSVDMGRAGRAFVIENYPWQKSVDLQFSAYEEVLRSK